MIYFCVLPPSTVYMWGDTVESHKIADKIVEKSSQVPSTWTFTALEQVDFNSLEQRVQGNKHAYFSCTKQTKRPRRGDQIRRFSAIMKPQPKEVPYGS